MQKIKSVIIGICVLLVFLCLFTAFIPRHVTVTRGIVIGVQRDSLQAFLEDFHQWPRWCSWMGADSAVTRTFAAATATREATVTWYPRGHPENKIFISILQTVPGDVRLFYQFKNLLPASGGFTLTAKREGGRDSTFVQWSLNIRLRWYPWEKLSGIAMDKVWGSSMKESLDRLKSGVYGEALPVSPDDAQGQ
jgi:hypothetical protein